jgi:hypothetical protein
MLYAHLNALRKVPRFAECRFRLIVECNLEQGSLICDSVLTAMSDVDVVCSTNHAYGIFTVPGAKIGYFARMRKLMARDAIAFYETIVSACPYQTGAMTREQLARANQEKFEHQIRAFRYVYDSPKKLGGIVKGIFTGKADHENKVSSRMQDDMVLALAFGLFFAMNLLSDPPFARLRTRMNRLY